MGSDGIPTWLWDLGNLWNPKLFQMINMSSGLLHKPWDIGITWSNKVLFMEYMSGIVQYI